MAPGKRRPYPPSKLAEAVAAVKSGMSIRDAESELGSPSPPFMTKPPATTATLI